MPPTRTQPNGKKPRLASVSELAAEKEACTKKFGKAAATTERYDQRYKQGQVWLAELMDTEESIQHPPGCPDLECYQWSSNDLRGAFDWTPNHASPWVLALFIATKCFGEERGKSTAWQIYAAFKQFWEQTFVPLLPIGDSCLSDYHTVTQMGHIRAIGSGMILSSVAMATLHFPLRLTGS